MQKILNKTDPFNYLNERRLNFLDLIFTFYCRIQHKKKPQSLLAFEFPLERFKSKLKLFWKGIKDLFEVDLNLFQTLFQEAFRHCPYPKQNETKSIRNKPNI